MIVVWAEVLLLVRVVEMQIVDKPRTFGLCPLHLSWLSASKILHERL
jgi:hypothetical protein